jgi:hypothetical protein
MPNPFSITAATETIPLDAQGRGSTTFTVSNTSGQIRRGRARLVPSDPGQASWLSVEGETERNFAADGTHQFAVRVAAPPGTPAGSYTFGLDMVSVENPDEEWSQGPKVRFEVAPSQPAGKPFPWWILVLILGLLLVGGLVAWLVSRNHKPVILAEAKTRCYVAEVMVGDILFPHRACFIYKAGQPDGCKAEYRYLGDTTQPPYDTTVHECTQHQAKFKGSHTDGYWFEMEVDFDTFTGSFYDSANQKGTFKLSPTPE